MAKNRAKLTLADGSPVTAINAVTAKRPVAGQSSSVCDARARWKRSCSTAAYGCCLPGGRGRTQGEQSFGNGSHDARFPVEDAARGGYNQRRHTLTTA